MPSKRNHIPKRPKPKGCGSLPASWIDKPLRQVLVFRPVPLKPAAVPEGEPDADEIERRCAEVRATWDAKRTRQAEGYYAPRRVRIPYAVAPGAFSKGLGDA